MRPNKIISAKTKGSTENKLQIYLSVRQCAIAKLIINCFFLKIIYISHQKSPLLRAFFYIA